VRLHEWLKKLKPEDFVASWKSGKSFGLTFDLSTTQPADMIHLWYSDQLPVLRIDGSKDGVNWTHLADYPKQPATTDVLDATIKWKASSGIRYLRISFGDRDPGNALTLVEAEIWSH
jgi:hypothetical protein